VAEGVAKGDPKARLEFACPPRQGFFGEFELELLDPADPDERRVLILAEHPELADAIDDNRDEIDAAGQPLNPHLHITIHEIVANQLWADDPPEVWQTACRLLDAGYERHEILHMMGSALTGEIWTLLHERKGADLSTYVARLRALPGSWEAMRG
jgi:hypothetical protein